MNPAFSLALARSLAQASALAYRQATVTDPRTNARANLTLDAAGNLVAAFKGSSAPADFIQDAKFGLAAWAGAGRMAGGTARVHTGFQEDFSAIQAPLLEQIKAFFAPAAAPPRRLYLTGHSLGGALALLAAPVCGRLRLPLAGVYTFGQPRVGDRTFAGLYDSEAVMPGGARLRDLTCRVVNENDVVPRTPPWLLGYRHAGTEVFLPVTGGWWLNPAPWWKGISDLLGLGAAWRHRREALVREHFLAAYQARLGACPGRPLPATAAPRP